jgi:hypothetical protein
MDDPVVYMWDIGPYSITMWPPFVRGHARDLSLIQQKTGIVRYSIQKDLRFWGHLQLYTTFKRT